MKKLISMLILGTIGCFFQSNAQKIKVNCTIELDGTYKPDSVFLGLYPTDENFFESGTNPPNPVFFSPVSNNKISFESEPGIYMIGSCAWKYAHGFKQIYLDPNEKSVNIKIIMRPQLIGYGHIDKIEKVEITGNFNGYNPGKTVQLEKQGNVWRLTSIPAELKTGQKYYFMVNGENTDDLLNDNIFVDKLWLSFQNIYEGNEIVFDPSLYGKNGNFHHVTISSQSIINEQIDSLGIELGRFSKFIKETQTKLFRGTDDEKKKSADSIFSRLTKIEKKYDPGFRQLFIEKKLKYQITKLISVNPALFSSQQEQLKEFISGNKFKTFFTDYLNLLNALDPKSYMLDGSFTESLMLMKNLTKISPEILTEYNLSPDYFDEFAEKFIQNSPNVRLCCNVLYQMASMQIIQDPNKAENTLKKLSEYDFEKYIPKERVAAMLAQLNVKIGKFAPDFNVTTLKGSDIKLSDYKGKFVFIDFWGSWCSPCLREIPNIKNLYSKVAREKLEIIGLAGNDKEESLQKCIADNGIEYPNAMASQSLLSIYGIRKFPTSFLVNPNGKIIRMDMRGEDELNLIADEIEHYFK